MLWDFFPVPKGTDADFAVAVTDDSLAPRQGGTNSINIRKIVKIGRQALHDFCEIQKAAAKKRG